jgi:hypothetical protein
MPLTLRDVISSGNYKLTKVRLDSNKNVDLLQDDGILIQLAIGSGKTELVEYLMRYFEENQLSEYDADSRDALMLRNQMRHVIEGVGSWIKSDAMRSSLSSYYTNSDSSEEEQSDDDLANDSHTHPPYNTNNNHNAHDSGEQLQQQLTSSAVAAPGILQQQAMSSVHHTTNTANHSITSWLQGVPAGVVDGSDNAATALLGQDDHVDAVVVHE